uniref:M-phase phosphoprotein 6 n=1 Tax=Suricata suricatta TaxID=37032 RepID=A0A673VC88_SURSU
MAAERKTKLSKNLLRMKFMQRGLDSETKKQLEEEEKKMISEEHWYLDLPELKEKECFIIEEQSFLLCEDLLYGRMSFRGFNPEVEKLMLQMNAKNKTEEVEDETVELDVSDEEMARRYETLVGTVGKKFAKKRDRANYEEDENGHVKPTVKHCMHGRKPCLPMSSRGYPVFLRNRNRIKQDHSGMTTSQKWRIREE